MSSIATLRRFWISHGELTPPIDEAVLKVDRVDSATEESEFEPLEDSESSESAFEVGLTSSSRGASLGGETRDSGGAARTPLTAATHTTGLSTGAFSASAALASWSAELNLLQVLPLDGDGARDSAGTEQSSIFTTTMPAGIPEVTTEAESSSDAPSDDANFWDGVFSSDSEGEHGHEHATASEAITADVLSLDMMAPEQLDPNDVLLEKEEWWSDDLFAGDDDDSTATGSMRDPTWTASP